MRAFLISSAFLTISILVLGCAAGSGGGDSHSSAVGHSDDDCDRDAGACGERPDDVPPVGCAFSQGYWKNHEEGWPVLELTLGTTTYVQADLLEILRTPVRGNGLISMAHQLIAAKLDVANGAEDDDLLGAIDDADALIGDLVVPPVGDGYLHPKVIGGLNGALATDPVDCED